VRKEFDHSWEDTFTCWRFQIGAAVHGRETTTPRC